MSPRPRDVRESLNRCVCAVVDDFFSMWSFCSLACLLTLQLLLLLPRNVYCCVRVSRPKQTKRRRCPKEEMKDSASTSAAATCSSARVPIVRLSCATCLPFRNVWISCRHAATYVERPTGISTKVRTPKPSTVLSIRPDKGFRLML